MLIILSLSACSFSCQERSDADRKEIAETDVVESDFENPWCVNLQEWRNEYLSIDSLEIYNNEGKINFTGQTLDFTDQTDLRVSFPKMELSGRTSIAELSTLFPNSAKLNRRSGYAWGGTVSIFSHKGEADRNFWILEFRREMLAKMTLYKYNTSVQ